MKHIFNVEDLYYLRPPDSEDISMWDGVELCDQQ